MNTTMQGRYRLLASDFEVLAAGAAVDAEQTAHDALRLGMSYDDFPGLEYTDLRVEHHLWTEGVVFSELEVTQRSAVARAFMDTYRVAYAATWEGESG